LRARAGSGDAGELASLAELLAGDRREGARELAAIVARRLARERREAERLRRLFAPTAALWASGARRVAGVDEVGMGPLAGPVVAAAVVLRPGARLPGLDDSKRLAPPARARLARAIREQSLALAVAEVEAAEVDRLNVYRAGLEAMRRAIAALPEAPEHVLVDARTIPALALPQTSLVHGDSRDASIAAASIVAKVHRDALMDRLDALHPGYGFAAHKGYATADHVAALRRLGPCREHRRSFAPVGRA
jgi:ribonuclease HII